MLAMLVLVPACGSGSKEPASPATVNTADRRTPQTAETSDFRMICDEATRAAAMPGSANERRYSFATTVMAKLRTDSARNTMKAAGEVPDGQRLATLRQGATELKIADWDCPAIATLYGPQTDRAPVDPNK